MAGNGGGPVGGADDADRGSGGFADAAGAVKAPLGRRCAPPGGYGLWIVAALVLAAAFWLSGLGGAGEGAATALEARLERALSKISGAGEVSVLVYAQQTEQALAAWSGAREDAEVTGVLVIASGATDAGVAALLAQAAATALGTDQNRIGVFVMEGD